jgi:hypothetical protein
MRLTVSLIRDKCQLHLKIIKLKNTDGKIIIELYDGIEI